MSGVREALARGWDLMWRPLAAGGLVAGVTLALGMTVASAVVLALAVVTLAAVVLRVDGRAEPRPARAVATRHEGARGDVHDLAWTMVGRDGRAGERALRRLRDAAARRIARHGLDLGDPDQADAVARLVGARAYGTLTRRGHPLPTVGDLSHALGVLERLGATRDRTDPDPDPANLRTNQR
ncbi:hypothetical protein [Cellulomonas wangsupingiae]|uniref:DUF4129 domain-containing protein n=1 Tax=Cellulomonas wangsupingiae TaxID=2968085 RepID=A0ABY5K3B6_9CELL|nr:hypothetical protein [Cellulomonas wangsupingiae]MCC2333686.1 hypothetical protein [Cellulomonas wangsupingiae]UUI64951.1 hypothetical protein NP075_17855 [Cellulomonas wangsupingiae]